MNCREFERMVKIENLVPIILNQKLMSSSFNLHCVTPSQRTTGRAGSAHSRQTVPDRNCPPRARPGCTSSRSPCAGSSADCSGFGWKCAVPPIGQPVHRFACTPGRYTGEVRCLGVALIPRTQCDDRPGQSYLRGCFPRTSGKRSGTLGLAGWEHPGPPWTGCRKHLDRPTIPASVDPSPVSVWAHRLRWQIHRWDRIPKIEMKP